MQPEGYWRAPSHEVNPETRDFVSDLTQIGSVASQELRKIVTDFHQTTWAPATVPGATEAQLKRAGDRLYLKAVIKGLTGKTSVEVRLPTLPMSAPTSTAVFKGSQAVTANAADSILISMGEGNPPFPEDEVRLSVAYWDKDSGHELPEENDPERVWILGQSRLGLGTIVDKNKEAEG